MGQPMSANAEAAGLLPIGWVMVIIVLGVMAYLTWDFYRDGRQG